MEILTCKNEIIKIEGSKFPSQTVESRFVKLDSRHVEYVLSYLKSNKTKVKNIKKYLWASLFKALITM